MSKIDAIENELTRINSAKFQQLCDTYFFYKGYERITCFGSVIGKEKTRKGTPDSYIPVENNKYIFIEYTTKEKIGNSKKFFRKLEEDVEICFDESKSGIKNSQIKKVILCFTSRISPEEHEILKEKCKSENKNCEFEPIGIDKLKFEILKYPNLGRDFLNILIGTFQILTASDYIKEYEKGLLATPLSNTFYFREKELKDVAYKLESNDFILVVGSAGVGKSRFALECCYNFRKKNGGFEFFCISNKDSPIYDDLRTCLIPNKNYIILFDDANRAAKHFGLILRILNEEREGKLKIVVTVRDYAADEVKRISNNYPHYEIKLEKLDDGQLRKILSSEDFNIKNGYYLDRIIKISSGNPRLAIMAAAVALKTNNLSELNNASEIYDKYYDSIVKDLEGLDKAKLLKVLGIVSFFGVLRKEDNALNRKIHDVFDVSHDSFWENILELHRMEIVDLFEKYIVKISDQVLSAYFFYKVFVKDEILCYSTILMNFFDNYREKIRETIIFTFNTFGHDKVYSKLERHMLSKWDQVKKREEKALEFLDIFWFYIQTETLCFISERIEKLPDILNPQFKFEYDKSYIYPDRYLGILKRFRYIPETNFIASLEISFKYIEKKPESLPYFLKYVNEEFTIDKNDYMWNYYIQTNLFDFLLRKIENGDNKQLFLEIFFSIVSSFLKTEFEKNEAKGNSVTLYRLRIQLIPEMKELREKIWTFFLKEFNDFPERIYKILSEYISQVLFDPQVDIIRFDSSFLLPFFKENFKRDEYFHCKLVQMYLKKMDNYKIEYDISLKEDFECLVYRHSLILDLDFTAYRNCKSVEEIETFKKKELRDFFTGYDLEGFKHLINNIRFLAAHEDERKISTYKKFLEIVLNNLLENDFEAYLRVLTFIIKTGNMIEFYANNLINRTLAKLGEKHRDFYNLLDKSIYSMKIKWKLGFFEYLNESYVNDFYIDELIKIFFAISANIELYDLDFLKKYDKIPRNLIIDERVTTADGVSRYNQNIFTLITSIAIKKIREKKVNIFLGSDFINKFQDYFVDEVELLKEIYIHHCKTDRYYDIKGEEIKTIVAIDENFVTEYLKEKFPQDKYFSYNEIFPNFDFIWEMKNYEKIVDYILNFFKEKETKFGFVNESSANIFFKNAFRNESIWKTINIFISSFIKRNKEDKNAIQLIFSIITYSLNETRNSYLTEFLILNQDIDVFKKLIFILSHNHDSNASRSKELESGYQSEIEYCQTILGLLDEFEEKALYLNHKLFLEEKIKNLRQLIQEEKRREFLDFH